MAKAPRRLRTQHVVAASTRLRGRQRARGTRPARGFELLRHAVAELRPEAAPGVVQTVSVTGCGFPQRGDAAGARSTA